MDDICGSWPKWVSGTLNVISGALQMAAGAAIGATVGWTGVGAVAAAVLIANGAATATQGVGQIVNHVTQSNKMREDNIIRSGAQRIGYAVAGNTGATVAGVVYDATVIAASMYAPFARAPGNTSQTGYVSRGSSAIKQPSNLTEQLALEQVISNPQGTKLPITMNDPRWPASEGWVKMQQIVNTNAVGKVCVHYVYNEVLGLFDDFKIK